VSGKIDVIESLLPKVDTLIIGGGTVFTFFKAQAKEVGGSLVEDDRLEMARTLLAKVGSKLQLPADIAVTDLLDLGARKVGDDGSTPVEMRRRTSLATSASRASSLKPSSCLSILAPSSRTK
jgi:phosphoglycerate kinase